MHEFMFPSEEATCHPVEVILGLREMLSDLPPTRATFNFEALRDKRPDAVDPRRVTLEMIMLVGSWPVPDWYGSKQHQLYVNPNYLHRDEWADAPVPCDCGGIIGHERYTGERWEKEHTDECEPISHYDCKRRMWQNRKDIVLSATRLNKGTKYIADRLAVDPRAVSQLTQHMRIPRIRELRNQGQAEIGETILELKDEYTVIKLAQVYGVTDATIYRYIDKHEQATTAA